MRLAEEEWNLVEVSGSEAFGACPLLLHEFPSKPMIPWSTSSTAFDSTFHVF